MEKIWQKDDLVNPNNIELGISLYKILVS